MATKQAAGAAKKGTTQVVKWDEELAKMAEMARGTEASVMTGNFISLKGGIMAYGGNPVKDNQMDVVVLDAIIENVYYEGRFDPDTVQSPLCYAFGRDEDEMKPHIKVFEAGDNQNATCKGCEHNEWASSETGRGKACKNARRLAVISAEALDGGPDAIRKAKVAFVKVPVTSVKAYASYVNQLAAANKPPLAFVTQLQLTPDVKTQFKLSFSAEATIEDGALLGALIERAKAVQKEIEFPYQPREEEAPASRRAPAKKGAKKAAGKAAPVKAPDMSKKRKY